MLEGTKSSSAVEALGSVDHTAAKSVLSPVALDKLLSLPSLSLHLQMR